MKQKFLTQSKSCAICREMMEAGQPFTWHKVTRSIVGAKVGGSYSLREIERFVPKHNYNCLEAKIDAEKRDRAILTARYAQAHGATAKEIAEILGAPIP